ncbi:MAG: hypothetical protein J0I90_04590, partial [Nitrosospira sp.]|nr:hypothetical protein [Nitrosospira sp.]
AIPEPLVFLSPPQGQEAEAQVFRYRDPNESQARIPVEALTSVITLKGILALTGQETQTR